MDKKLLLFDLDGTLLRSDNTVSARTLLAIDECRKRGYLTGISTSRCEFNIKRYREMLVPDIVISSDGALIREKDRIVFRSAFSADETRLMIDISRKLLGDDVEMSCDTLSGHFWRYKENPETAIPLWEGSTYCDFDDFHHETLKFCVAVSDPCILVSLLNSFPESDCVRFSDTPMRRFTKRNVGKRSSLNILSSELNISPESITAFGNDYADIEMLKAAGTGIAVSNAVDEVKRAADLIIPSNDDDGIASYLEDILITGI